MFPLSDTEMINVVFKQYINELLKIAFCIFLHMEEQCSIFVTFSV